MQVLVGRSAIMLLFVFEHFLVTNRMFRAAYVSETLLPYLLSNSLDFVSKTHPSVFVMQIKSLSFRSGVRSLLLFKELLLLNTSSIK